MSMWPVYAVKYLSSRLLGHVKADTMQEAIDTAPLTFSTFIQVGEYLTVGVRLKKTASKLDVFEEADNQ